MKIRNGFVSNSSSSSFILKTSEDMALALRYNIKFYKVSDIINVLEKEYESLKLFKKNIKNDKLPSFISNDLSNVLYLDMFETYIDQLKELKDYYITDPVDIDWASELDLPFQLFLGDL